MNPTHNHLESIRREEGQKQFLEKTLKLIEVENG
jgi:hypothetical protein